MRATAAEIRRGTVPRSEPRDRPRLVALPAPKRKSFQQARRRGPSRLAPCVALVILIALAVATWQASRPAWVASSWESDLDRFGLAVADKDLDTAAEAWADAYRSAMEADRDWRGPVAIAEAWQELVRRGGSDANSAWGARKLYLTALARAVDGGDIDGVIAVGHALSDLGDLDEVERCVRLARRLTMSGPGEGRRTRLDALESRLSAGLRQPEAESLVR